LAVYYLDTSALVKLYVRETGTDRMIAIAAGSDPPQLAILSLARAELYSAIRRRMRTGDIESDMVTQLLSRFESHLQTRYLRQSVSDTVLDMACSLIDRHPLRAYDAIQVAGCLTLRATVLEPPIFVCADRRLLATAQTENLTCLDPTE
jgi:predicted nucleic acid-binding protein